MRIFSGIQPTGAKHFGNYSGGFRQYAATQEQGEAFFCIVDLHSITVAYEPAELRESTLDLAAHALRNRARPRPLDRLPPEPRAGAPGGGLAAQLGVATFGELRRMTQFKEKGRPSRSSSRPASSPTRS